MKRNKAERSCSPSFYRSGFTLIELLVVVGIIAILASIAVPNFLEAQTRAKISRACADHRTLSVAIETYAVDQLKYPYYNNPLDYPTFIEPVVFVPTSVTTPIAYMSSLPFDVFPGNRTGLPPGTKTPYFYMHNYGVIYLGQSQSDGHVQGHYNSLTGGQSRAVMYTLWSFGPDLDDDHGTTLYDATNGAVSHGDMMRFGP
jgi:type II secretion system protein G